MADNPKKNNGAGEDDKEKEEKKDEGGSGPNIGEIRKITDKFNNNKILRGEKISEVATGAGEIAGGAGEIATGAGAAGAGEIAGAGAAGAGGAAAGVAGGATAGGAGAAGGAAAGAPAGGIGAIPGAAIGAAAGVAAGAGGAEDGVVSNITSITSPSGVLMLSIAVFFDTMGLLGFIPVIGWIIELISDIFAIMVIGLFLWIMGKIKMKLVIGFIIAAVMEAIPYVDDVAPFVSLLGMVLGVKIPASWIGFVYMALNSD